jgi:hypothetical protein
VTIKVTESRFDPEDEAFNEIERKAKQRIEAVRAAIDAQNISSCTKWVGLTDVELAEFTDMEIGSYDLCLEVEAKLKEKNT